jgi:hypothetical protein
MSTTSEMAKPMYMNGNEKRCRAKNAKGAKNGSLRRDAARDPRDAGATPRNCGLSHRLGPGFHAQVVDFPHIQVRNSKCGVRNYQGEIYGN